jgi:hypothetical protein
MIDPGSVGDWLQATLIAAALATLAATTQRALRHEEAAPARTVPSGEPTPTSADRTARV